MLEGAEAALSKRPRVAASHARYLRAHAPRSSGLAHALLLAAVPAVSAQAANRWIEQKAPLNIAHQGGEDEFPSNTMYAFRKAVRAERTCSSSTWA